MSIEITCHAQSFIQSPQEAEDEADAEGGDALGAPPGDWEEPLEEAGFVLGRS